MRHLIFTIVLIFCRLASFAQGDTSAFKAIAQKNNKPPTEHIYLHLNKPRYERADTIWFRLYDVTDGHRLSAISHTAYAELIGPTDTVLQKLNLKLEAGMASGDFALPITLLPGTYHIRAYTNWMRIQNSFYSREIVIGNPGKTPPTAKTFTTLTTNPTSTPSSPDIRFFPESGDLIDGLRNVVAYKATNPDGSPAMLIGTITGTDNEVLAEIQSNADGMGIFAIKPQPGESYLAKLTFTDGNSQNIRLPMAVASGYTLTINNHDKDTLQIKIAANTELQKQAAGQNFYLVAQSSGRVFYTASGKTDTTAYKIKIAKDRFPTGIIRFTLYAESGEPLNERIVFIQNKDNLDLKLDAKNENHAFELKAITQKDNTPTIGSFSATVFNEDKVPFDVRTAPTIMSSLLLSDELHGIIANPNHYLADVNNMDLLMLTQGYRKLEWKKQADTVQQQSIDQYQNEDGLTISGRITDHKGKPLTNAKVSLVSTNPIIKLDTLTNSLGKFAFMGLDIDEQIKFLLKAQNVKSNEVKITLDRPEPDKLSFPKSNLILDANNADTAANKQLLAAIQNSYKEEEDNFKKQKNKQLKEVTIKDKYDPDKKLAEELEGSANLNGPGHADQVVMGKDLVDMGCPILQQCLAIKFFQVVMTTPDRPYVSELVDQSRGHNNILGSGPITVFIDGNIGHYQNVAVEDIYSIELLTSAKYKAIYGHDAAGGLILITTKKGIAKNEMIPVEREPGLISFTYDGYYKSRTFYQPRYEANITPQPSAIYWKPDILTDKDGKATLNFNNAGKGHYRIVVEGIDGAGRLGHAEYTYEVK